MSTESSRAGAATPLSRSPTEPQRRPVGPWSALALAFAAGFALGGYLLRDTQPRTPLLLGKCKPHCFQPQQVAGLLASVGIQRAPGLIPEVVLEDDQCIAIRHPTSTETFHYVLFTKRDIRNIGEVAEEDIPALRGCVAMIGELARTRHLWRYRVYTNGPGKQEITHLHFHVVP